MAADSMRAHKINAQRMKIQYEMVTIRIHHFFDIIRDLRTGEKIPADTNYRHSYHSVANILRDSPGIKMKIVIGVDSVCNRCVHNSEGKCDDPLTTKKGFAMKHDYNWWLDNKILEICNFSEGQIVTPNEVCISAYNYLENIYCIYELDPEENINTRKKDFIDGLKFYSAHNNFKLKYLSKYST